MSYQGSAKYKARTELLLAYMTKYKDMPKRSLARVLHDDHPDIFGTIDDARSAIRIRTGSSGSRMKKRIGKTWDDFQETRHAVGDNEQWPESIHQMTWTPYEIADLGGIYLIIADLHIPFHDFNALMTTIKFAKKIGKTLKGIIILGDLFDQYTTSWWPKDPLTVTFDLELSRGRQFIAKLKQEFKGKKIIFKMANHENRFERLIISQHPALAASKSVRNMLKFEKIICSEGNETLLDGVDIVDPSNILYYKELAMIHGDELGRSMGTPVSAARSLFLKAKACCVQAHCHASSSHAKGDIFGHQIVTKSIGCLCDLHPQWKPLAQLEWNHGFALLDTRGSWDIENKRILDGTKIVAA